MAEAKNAPMARPRLSKVKPRVVSVITSLLAKPWQKLLFGFFDRRRSDDIGMGRVCDSPVSDRRQLRSGRHRSPHQFPLKRDVCCPKRGTPEALTESLGRLVSRGILAWGTLLIAMTFEEASLDQNLEPSGQNIGRNAETLFELVEPR